MPARNCRLLRFIDKEVGDFGSGCRRCKYTRSAFSCFLLGQPKNLEVIPARACTSISHASVVQAYFVFCNSVCTSVSCNAGVRSQLV
eukprot:1155905-Pelagomonas_calceolata.AAC.6